MWGIFGGAFVALAVVVILLISLLGGGSSGKAGNPIGPAPAPAVLVNTLETVPASQLTAAGTGISSGLVSVNGVFQKTPTHAPITKDGKPALVYIGAEYCPYCAASRWPLIIALSRFGTFSGLQTIGSSPLDVWANTRTFTFEKATYSSPYLAFESTEFTTNVCASKPQNNACPNDNYEPLQAFTPLDKQLINEYEKSGLSIPFLAWGGKFVSEGALYLPTAINLGNSQNSLGWHPMTWAQISENITHSPLTTAGAAILGSANVYTGAICDMTGGKPGSVCNTAPVQAAEKALAKA
jgi:Domain of unknown function (DUF929)